MLTIRLYTKGHTIHAAMAAVKEDDNVVVVGLLQPMATPRNPQKLTRLVSRTTQVQVLLVTKVVVTAVAVVVVVAVIRILDETDN